MLFVAKKLVSRLLFPLPLSLALAILGLLFLWFSSRQKLGKVLVSLGILLLLLFSSGTVAGGLITPLERQYLPYSMPGNDAVPDEEIRYVVVLAGGIRSLPEYPITRQVGSHAMARLVEAVRIHQRCPNSRLILSGGRGADPDLAIDTLTNYRFATLLGVDPAKIIIQNSSLDTDDEARNIRPIVGDAPFVLVTSATHLPRAMALFRGAGMQPIPGPTDWITGLVQIWVPESLFPSSGALATSEVAVYEFLGTLWAKLTGLM